MDNYDGNDYGEAVFTSETHTVAYDTRKSSTDRIPWKNSENWDGKSMVKARWIRVRWNGGPWVYAQWADAGPYFYDDADYVFGDGSTKAANMEHRVDDPYAGIDLSPSVMKKLGVNIGSEGDQADNIDWQFVNFEDVPDGPWKKYISSNEVNWN